MSHQNSNQNNASAEHGGGSQGHQDNHANHGGNKSSQEEGKKSDGHGQESKGDNK